MQQQIRDEEPDDGRLSRPVLREPRGWEFLWATRLLGSERGGELAAVAFTIIENCKRHGLDLRQYLASTMKALIGEGEASAPALTPKSLATHPAKLANQAAA